MQVHEARVLKLFLKLHITGLLLVLLMSSCSTQKNTWSGRALLSLNTRYNVYYNGKTSYEEGLQAILNANKDDYSRVIHMYPISNHEAAKSATSQMNRAIEKSRKAIKTRSLKTKPEARGRKARDPKFRALLKQEEFNPFMPKVWMLLAQAEFHKADFLGSVGTFNYIARHFSNDVNLVQSCQLWVIRAYAEMGWLYEAEELLSKINQKQLNAENAALYASVYADLLLKRGQYREAIPLLELAASKENDRDMKMRFNFLLAQLYQHAGDKKAAYDRYSSLLRMNPPYEMAFNARLNRSGLFLGNMNDNRRELLKMTKNYNNREYLDQLFAVIARSYLHQKDTLKALQYYAEAIENSTRNGIEKAVAHIEAADLNYLRRQYVLAQPDYDAAAKIIPIDHPDYKRVSMRAEMLAGLVVQYEEVQLQDSLQRLSAMSPAQRLESVKAWIAKLEKEEALEAEREAKRQEKAAAAGNAQQPSMNMNMIGEPDFGSPRGGNQGAWYFYNTALVRSGETDFQRQWGKRKLEDNWRRSNKSATLFTEENTASNGQEIPVGEDGNLPAADTLSVAGDLPENKRPEFYLKQIPVTPEQITRSNELWAKAQYSMGVIFKDQLEDFPMALQSFGKYLNRFPADEQVLDALYHSYMLHIRLNQTAEAEMLRNRIIREFGNSVYAQMLTNPNFVETKMQMFTEQDSIYESTYRAFNQSKYADVFANVDYISRKYPLSPLMPRFLFLKALSVGKSGTRDEFELSLTDLLEKYPESGVSSMTKDMLALLKQGREAQQGTTHGSMLARREVSAAGEGVAATDSLSFRMEKMAEQRLILISPEKEQDLYALQFQLAVFNFSRFILKDFELVIARIDASRNGLSVLSFDNFRDADWYLKAILEDEKIAPLLSSLQVTPLIISEFDYGLTRAGLSLNEYLTQRAEQEAKAANAEAETKAAISESEKKAAQPASSKNRRRI